MLTWLSNHKALAAAIATAGIAALNAAAPIVPPPYGEILLAAGTALAALSRGLGPATPTK